MGRNHRHHKHHSCSKSKSKCKVKCPRKPSISSESRSKTIVRKYLVRQVTHIRSDTHNEVRRVD